MGMITETIYLDLGVAGEHELDVEFFYTPEERQTRDEPGCSEQYEIMGVYAHDEKGQRVDIGFLIEEEVILKELVEIRNNNFGSEP